MDRLSNDAGVTLEYFREMSGDAHVLRLPERLPLEQVRLIAERLMQLPEVEYAEADQIFTRTGAERSTIHKSMALFRTLGSISLRPGTLRLDRAVSLWQ
jgi:hypothetical protein